MAGDAIRSDPLAEWADRVAANRSQSERVREQPDSGDFYAPVSGFFVVDPRRIDDPFLDALLALARPGEKWLDIGAGAGRFALPLALVVGEVIAVEPSVAMRRDLEAGMAEHGIPAIRTIAATWPIADLALAATIRADVSLIAHLGYDVEEIGSFLDAMEAASDRLCVAMLGARAPSWLAGPFWPDVHGEERRELPALPLFLDVLRARGREPAVRLIDRPGRTFRDRDDLLRWLRNQLFVRAGSRKDDLLVVAAERRSEVGLHGIRLTHDAPVLTGIVTWQAR